MQQISPRALLRPPMTSDGRVQTRFFPATIVCCVFLFICYVALVGTNLGHQLDDSAYFVRGAVSRQIVKLDTVLLMRVTSATILSAASLLLLISGLRRSFLVGLVATTGFFAAVVGAEILKRVLPWQALVPDDTRIGADMQLGSYPSGHATIATAFVLGLLLVCPARWRSWLGVVAGVLSSSFATGVVFTGWHRVSDALGALAWSGVCMNLAGAVAVRLRGRPAIGKPRAALAPSVVLGIVMLVACFPIAAMTAPQYSHRDLPFFLLSGLIIAGAFTLTAWYSRQLNAVDFSKPKEA